MFVKKDFMIAITKGDSASFTETLSDRVPADGAEVLFTVKKSTKDSALIKKTFYATGGSVNVELLSEDTNKLEEGKYVWDLRVINSPSDVYTPMPASMFIVMGAVGDV